MTQPSENKRDLPDIGEEDVPLHSGDSSSNTNQDELSREKNADPGIDFRKFSLGSSTLGWCIFLMFACVILSMICPDNDLVQNAFDAFKLIVMTILGYIFGSNTKDQN